MGTKCNTEDEKFWLQNFRALFCTWSPVPKGSKNSGMRFNAMTRLMLYITLLMLLLKVKYWWVFLVGSIILLSIIYLKSPHNENFAILSQDYTKEMITYNDSSNGKRMVTPQFEVPVSYQASQVRNPSPSNQLRLMPIDSQNISNTYGSDYTNRVLNTTNEPGKRDPQAGVQYYTPYVGINPKTNIPPIIAPRITDQDVWGKQSTVVRDINKLQMVDVTNEAIDTYDMAQIPTRYPYAQGYKVAYPLALPIQYQSRNPGSVWAMNPVGQDPDIGFYNAQTDLNNSADYRDFDRNVLPLQKNVNSYVFPNVDMNIYNANTTPNYYQYDSPITTTPPVQYQGVTAEMVEKQSGGTCNTCNVVRDNGKVREGFAFVDLDTKPAEQPQQPPVQQIPQQLNSYYSQPAQYPLTVKYNTQGERGMLGGQYTEMSRVPPGQNVQIPAVTDQLMYQSPVYSYTDKYFKSPAAKLFLQEIQPSLYSYAVDQTPINSSVGISYAPQNPPRVLSQIEANGTKYPLYSRVDPQLVRMDGTPGQQAQQPTRSDWSAEYSNFQAPAGSINFEDIYDPRFTSYGDPYRSYSDVNLGQIQYYYSDIDAYRMPNFITRSNVDFVDFRTPNGQIWPYYNRNVSIDEVRGHVENQVTTDELFHREDLMSLQMDKINRERWQTRFAPLDNNHSYRGSTAGAGI
jgi:hypothetical protein